MTFAIEKASVCFDRPQNCGNYYLKPRFLASRAPGFDADDCRSENIWGRPCYCNATLRINCWTVFELTDGLLGTIPGYTTANKSRYVVAEPKSPPTQLPAPPFNFLPPFQARCRVSAALHLVCLIAGCWEMRRQRVQTQLYIYVYIYIYIVFVSHVLYVTL
jgi:hypothetical protein